MTSHPTSDSETLAARFGRTARWASDRAAAGGRWLTDSAEELALQLPGRDLAAIRAQYGDKSADELAADLVQAAARATSAVGVAGGVAASLDVVVAPLLLSAPVQVATETLAVLAIEMRLVAELHEVYGAVPTGTPAVRAAAYLGSWTRRRGLDPLHGAADLPAAISTAARRQLRRRLVRRAGLESTSVLPFLAGAVAGATVNSRETRRLGERIAADLRKQANRSSA